MSTIMMRKRLWIVMGAAAIGALWYDIAVLC